MSNLNSYWFTNFLIEATELKKTGTSQVQICKQLAAKYKIKAPTLRIRWQRHQEKNKKKENAKSRKTPKGHNVLATEDEAAIVTVLRTASKSNKAIQKTELISFVRKKYKNNDPFWRGDKWLKCFLK